SPQQRRLWSLMCSGGTPYRVQCAALIDGPLDTPALVSALEGVVARHEILRTTFRRLPGMNVPVQVIDEGGVEWGPKVDLSAAPERERHAAFEELFEEMKGVPFSLDRGPLVRAALLGLAPGKRILLLGLSALCTDAAAAKNLVGEVARAAAAPDGDSAPADDSALL
ncbi:MAG: non-ribosomal peptide synthetase, partial [Acidobacteria bacterium]